MGFNVILDVIGSMIIGGLLMLILFRLNDAATENTFNYGGELTSQQNLSTIVEILENDFRKIGYCKDWVKIPDPTKAILFADSTKIKFITDIDNDSNVDTMTYYLGPTSELSGTPNPRDRLLYRIVNSEPAVGVNLGVTQFRLMYYDSFGDEMTFPILNTGAIAKMAINIRVENVAGYNNQYSTVFWRQVRLVARNLNNR
jgi:hypothetical protein